MLKVKKLDTNAKMPTVGHPGEDLGFDLFALEDTVLPFGKAVAVRTGIAAQFIGNDKSKKFGLLLRDRSSMAAKGITVSAGVVDAGYTGELKVIMTNNSKEHSYEHWANGYGDVSYRAHDVGYQIKAGAKIAQMLPTEVFTGGSIVEVSDLEVSSRGNGGFGSTGV